MKRKDIIALCAKDITGNINEIEKEALNMWLSTSEEHIREYEECKRLWVNTKPSENLKEPDIDSNWLKLSEKLELNKRSDKVKTYSSPLVVWWQDVLNKGLKPAFAIVILAVIGSAAFWLIQESSPQFKLTEIKTGNGVHRRIVLPDSSTVFLNSGSSVRYTNPMGDDVREVELSGEGFFSVRKGNKPFVVKTDNANVTVLGTKFNVWARDAKTKVVVQEGSVNLSDPTDKTKSVMLAASEASSISPGDVPTGPAKVNARQLLGWMDGKLVFYKSPLIEITGELERYYDMKFAIADKDLNELTLTGSFKDEDPETLLSMICIALGVEYIQLNENEYVIIKKQQS